MNWADPILEHGGLLLVGASSFLALGLLINLLQRAPIQRIRIAELAVGCALLFVALTLAPMPRAFAPEAAPLVESRPPIPQFDVTPYLHVLQNQPQSERAESEAILSETLLARPESAPLPRAGIDSAVATPPLIDTPLIFDPQGPTASAPLPYAKIALFVWLAGAALASAWLLLGAWRLRRVLRGSRPAQRHVLRLLHEQGVDLPRNVRLRLSETEIRPFCIGALRPTIVIPRSLLEEEQSASLAPVVQHELAHALQGDARGLWLFALALVPLWFHPLYWWLRAQHRFSTELVADAIAAGKTSQRAYARELVHLVERQAEQATPVLSATALFRKRSDFYQRMQMLLTRKQSLATRTSLRRRALHGFLSFGLLTGAASVGGATPVSAQEPEEDPRAIIQQLQAENTQLRADLHAMQAVLSELKDMLAQLQAQQNADREAEARMRIDREMDRLNARDAQVDALMENLQDNSLETIDALRALGYVVVDENPGGYLPHTVQPGDTMAKIAGMAGLMSQEGLQSIAELNPDLFELDPFGGVAKPVTLSPGTTVLIPLRDASIPSSGNANARPHRISTRLHTVKAGESIYSIAKKHDLLTLELQKIFVKLNPSIITLDAEGRVGSTRPLRVGDKLQIPVTNALRGSVTTNIGGIDFSGVIEPGHGSGGARGGRRAVDPATVDILGTNELPSADGNVVDSVPILSDIPLVGDLFQDGTQPGPAQPGSLDPRLKPSRSLPAVNLAECMELSFRAIDMQAELELAMAQLEHTEALAKQALVSELELRQERVRMMTLERKFGLSRNVLEARIHDLKQQIDELASRYTEQSPSFPHREIELRKQAIAILSETL